jgi:hypothetical protein
MKLGGPRFFKRSVLLAIAGILLVLTACTGKGGGYLPPDGAVFTGQAPFGFTFSCEDKGGLNPPTGKLSIELAYADKGTNPLGSSFGIHGIVDVIDPVLESAVCSGQQPPPGGSELIFLGRYRLTTSAPANFPTTCATRQTKTTPLCRFEVIVRDNDGNLAPSPGDYFSIKLSTVTTTPCNSNPPDPTCSELPPASVVYARAGLLQGGNITVK